MGKTSELLEQELRSMYQLCCRRRTKESTNANAGASPGAVVGSGGGSDGPVAADSDYGDHEGSGDDGSNTSKNKSQAEQLKAAKTRLKEVEKLEKSLEWNTEEPEKLEKGVE